MSRIKGRYVALVTLDFSVTRDENTYPLEKIRNQNIMMAEYVTGFTNHYKIVFSIKKGGQLSSF